MGHHLVQPIRFPKNESMDRVWIEYGMFTYVYLRKEKRNRLGGLDLSGG